MSTWQSGGGFTSRGGLNPRSNNAPDQVQISIGKFDYDAEVADLHGHVKKLKEMSLAIDDERKQQGEIINQLEEALDKAKSALRHTSKRLTKAYRDSKSNHLLYLVLFAIAVFFGVYMLGKMYRMGKLFFG